eukprot:6607615-Heterocapsa_arctica.AAC.1
MIVRYPRHVASFPSTDANGQQGNGSFSGVPGPGHFLGAPIGAGGQVIVRGAAERAHIMVLSPTWVVITNPLNITDEARAGAYSRELQVDIQQVCGMMATLAPVEQAACKAPARHAERAPWAPSQPPPPVSTREPNQAYAWIQKVFAAIAGPTSEPAGANQQAMIVA